MGKLNLFSDLEISTFNVDNSARKFYHQFKEMNKFIRRGRSKFFNECEIFCLEDKVIFRIQGSEVYVNCRPTNLAKAKFYFVDLLEVLIETRDVDLKFTIQKNSLLLNDRILSSKGELVDSKDSEFNLDAGLGSLNFGEVNLNIPSWQKEVYTFKSTGEEIHMQTLKKDAQNAALLLKKYKVDSNKILHLMMDNLDLK